MNIRETLKSWISIIAALATFALWIDTRYMHTSISNQRHYDLKIEFYERQLIQLERKMDKEGYILSTEEQREYDLFKSTVKFLETERNKLIGLE